MKFYLGEYTYEEVKERIGEVPLVILPMGSTEQHGPHLPLDTDIFDAIWAVEKAMENVSPPKPLILPPLAYGVSLHHQDFPGTISLKPETLISVIKDIGSSIFSWGAKVLLIVNGHGGNKPALLCAAQELHYTYGLLTVVETGELASYSRQEIFETKNDVHAGAYETSTSLANRPEAVKKEKIQNPELFFPSPFLSLLESSIPCSFRTREISSTGVIGQPECASKEKGETFWNIYIPRLTSLIEDLKGVSYAYRET